MIGDIRVVRFAQETRRVYSACTREPVSGSANVVAIEFLKLEFFSWCRQMKRLVIDLDHTLCVPNARRYDQAEPKSEVISQVRKYKDLGFQIVIHTSRNVNTHQSNVGKINAHTLPVILEWLKANLVPYDEIYVGKPWCGNEGFYVDDRAVRPDEFVNLSYAKIMSLMKERA